MARNAAVLFGRIAVERGHLTAEQLEGLLQEQSQASQGAETVLLGDLCVQKGLLTQNQVRRILESQGNGEGATTTLGALAVRNGFATTQEIELALEAQKQPEGGEGRPPAKLGEILLAMGTLTSQKHKALLLAQSRLREEDLDETGEFELDTREIALADPVPASSSSEPVAWLIQESGEGTGQLFRLGPSATLGRMPSHAVPVADMGASREHASIEFSPATRQHVIKDLDSRNGTLVNGVLIDRLTPLQTGDLIRIGETSLRYASAMPPSTGKAETPPGPRPARAAELLRKARALSAGLLPGLHVQRKGFALASLAGLVSTLLPWTRVAGQASTFGVRTALGVLTLVLFAAALALSLLRDRARPLDRPFLLGLLAATSLAAILAIVKLVALALDPAAGAGIGVPLAVVAGLSVPLALWFTRTPPPPAPAPEPPATPDAGVWARLRGTAVRAGETTVRLFKGISGRKARERARAADRRDEILVELGRAALEAGVTGPEAFSSRKAAEALQAAKDRFEKVGKETSARDLLIARSDLKWAGARLERALRKLGRLAVDKAIPLEGRQAAVAEVQGLDVRLEEAP